MLLYFRKNKLPIYEMLDVMAVTTCLVHSFGRVGCFLAGCCYGKPTEGILGISFHNEACYAKPLGVPLHPTQLYEALFIMTVMFFLLYWRSKKSFPGQLFFFYLLSYAVGRFFIEYLRGDLSRGYIIESYLSNSQLIAFLIFSSVLILYFTRSRGGLHPKRR